MSTLLSENQVEKLRQSFPLGSAVKVYAPGSVHETLTGTVIAVSERGVTIDALDGTSERSVLLHPDRDLFSHADTPSAQVQSFSSVLRERLRESK